MKGSVLLIFHFFELSEKNQKIKKTEVSRSGPGKGQELKN